MGMTIPGMSTGSAAPASGAGGGKAAASATTSAAASASGAAAIFGQSLQQLMGAAVAGSETGSETPANPLLAALQQLIAAAGQVSGDENSSAEGDTKQLDAKLDDLLEQLDSLDGQLQEHPELMSMLQGWIQQAQALLNPQEGEAGGETQASAVNALASNPATLKFALQDTVVQLIDMQKSDQTAPDMKALAQQALTALQQTVEEVGKETKINAKSVAAQQSAGVVQGQEIGTAVKNDSAVGKTDAQTQLKSAADQTVVQSKSQAQQSGADTQQGDGTDQDAQQELKPQATITAGELALRANGTTPAKPVEAVPVQRIPQEVAKLAVDRLEILRKEGFTEAKISLTPDHLGKVDIRLTMHAGQLVAHFVTEHAMAKDMLEQQMVQLRGTLQSQGITVERLEVTQSSSLQSQMDQNGNQSGNGQQQNGRSRSREEATDDARLTAELGEELGEWLRQKTAAQNGSSFVAEA
ncbi:hypothetical protein CDO73_20270 [Saccharibacillus sp. O23]|uniref:flagellar hook-length control protein FliK n=1 Tax=Saccharibacillus sp. O23 TaxID=2009338 RepID=UPI000B4E3825|nr:flagellar hook-length control protein FliK [Saccharibacillus sp. O23]OWR27847.1 hypothetical protein CDO73_20270 [Saccharibacillus sp. O23]